MSKAAMGVGIVGGIILLGFLWVTGNYNSLVTAENQVDKSWASVETQYQRRLDLVGNLVASVKGAQAQELAVFGKIAEARSRYLAADATPEAKVAAANEIETNIALIPRLQEAYPDLKSNTQVTRLMSELTGTENGIQAARDNFNTVANNYNTQIERFPKNLFANTFGFDEKELFKADDGAENAPKVQF